MLDLFRTRDVIMGEGGGGGGGKGIAARSSGLTRSLA